MQYTAHVVPTEHEKSLQNSGLNLTKERRSHLFDVLLKWTGNLKE